MKRTVKIIALCLALSAFVALFTGCDMIDEMRANHARLSDDRETIRYNGTTYKKLPNGAEIYCRSSYGDTYGNIAVTDSDVPVLLSNAMCHSSDYDKAHDIFSVYVMTAVDKTGIIHSYISSYDDPAYYCNEKDYDKYVEAIEKNTLDFIGIEYEVNYKVDEEYESYYTLDVLSEETSKEILGHIQNPEKMTEDIYGNIIYGPEYHEEIMGYVNKCDNEGLLAQSLDNFQILRDNLGNVFLVDHNTEKAVELTDKASGECNSDKYFYGDGADEFYPFGTWRDEDYKDDSAIGIIGGADGESDIVVGEANLFDVDF